MRTIDLKFEPLKVQVTQEEIMADLRYPVARKRREWTPSQAQAGKRL